MKSILRTAIAMNGYDDFITDDWIWNEDRDVEQEPEAFGCCMPDRCLMPGPHFPSECHDAEMLEAFEEEMQRSKGAIAHDS